MGGGVRGSEPHARCPRTSLLRKAGGGGWWVVASMVMVAVLVSPAGIPVGGGVLRAGGSPLRSPLKPLLIFDEDDSWLTPLACILPRKHVPSTPPPPPQLHPPHPALLDDKQPGFEASRTEYQRFHLLISPRLSDSFQALRLVVAGG